ncbi:MAG TPA: class I SAM-dependent methyltransferase [Planctomycetota bacterium]
MNLDLPPSGGASAGTSESSAARALHSQGLGSLPAPRHLFEFLTRSRHLHMGFFEGPADTLAMAQDRLVTRAARRLGRGSLVADVGCGLGGSVQLLASQGHRVYGLDPCAASIGYARTHAAAPRAQFLVADLAQFATRARGARFDALFLTEVLPHFRDLGAVFAHCRSVLRPGGLVLVHDVARLDAPAEAYPGLHARGAVMVAADAAGFDQVEGRDVTARVSPTLPRLLRALAEQRAEIQATFGATRPAIARELEEFEQRLRALELGFARQDLAYEASLLRCSTRLGTDSVVLRRSTTGVPEPAPVQRPIAPRPI